MVKIVINRSQQTAQYFVEDLGNKVELNMLLIKGGSFMMGAPEDEEGSLDSERPQHEVTIPTFFMGQYPITQAQWKAVALLPQVNRELKPDPSHFKGDNRPVERVSWFDAVEFCDRITLHTGRKYRLPSEAQWEYACRAGTTTPFHFGQTITTDLANYRGTDWEEFKSSGSYGRGTKGIYREETTDVGNFGVANAFGLYDMHGNVWEWCADHWHNSYEGASNDETIWLSSDEDGERLLRGGSWFDNPDNCRCASRNYYPGDGDGNNVGFRVVCGVL
ncbi:formylglycine-generating enzyme family protein [Aetokthonos hydrillicola Thurmond2011]|jgi:formylglycine-generating enzyme required for sulfatase activity|uniref:Formylglycine-generating enzyme family protein n=1 Tax=Aetokthonos hydrillicola Thurmond2011 TaxID=2712845 RepID=A0AAP5MCT4_9CYAN|nr:formylglycine-generating enzyme family protein [Aetokthonos hydrillicola]MBW4585231.1 formylglycine-generating enzyme family protein [Aetokthonos hydrillicola CCALA 1050]MDR9899567.1 formylglycine-generating enzyme family protein [Aetokthonos hydrillicola Thurmond2011]